ncbi:hypothetical protein [Pseudodesulfovibrio sediminis]|uniref:Tail fiber assembly protein n=1 Tax=Pseudodesulfovibrio sediminis TaxID=2810563 RepID=A0ABM7P978_9BACT|nr:hypothetical protein [Pseudodesulfovibrio sediminis]BCS89957.1 hypothetical protein PSDVSF_31990 [Pseudodesulfovibrio sediminis]
MNVTKIRFPNGDVGQASDFEFDGSTIPANYLNRRDGEPEADWLSRLAKVGTIPVRREPFSGDPNTHDQGSPMETEANGWLVISYPNPVAKVPHWHTGNLAVKYFSEGADVPENYTPLEPPHEQFSIWNGSEWNIDLDAAYASRQGEIVSGSDAALEPHAIKYGAFEQTSWAKQLKEAEAHENHNSTETTPWLDATTETAEGKNALAAKIIANDVAWSTLSGIVARQRRNYQAELDKIRDDDSKTDAEKVAAIDGMQVSYVA